MEKKIRANTIKYGFSKKKYLELGNKSWSTDMNKKSFHPELRRVIYRLLYDSLTWNNVLCYEKHQRHFQVITSFPYYLLLWLGASQKQILWLVFRNYELFPSKLDNKFTITWLESRIQWFPKLKGWNKTYFWWTI